MIRQWTFSTFGRFYTRTFHYLPGRFATCMKVIICDNVRTTLLSGGETSRDVAKRPSIETSKGAKRPGSESNRWQFEHK